MWGWDRKKAAQKAKLKNLAKREDYYAFIATLKSGKKGVDKDVLYDSRNEYIVTADEVEVSKIYGELLSHKDLISNKPSRGKARVYKNRLRKELGLKRITITQIVYDHGFIVSNKKVY